MKFISHVAGGENRPYERGLLTHLRDLLLELGRGFSFVGSQVPLTVDGQTFYLDRSCAPKCSMPISFAEASTTLQIAQSPNS
jgi:predicted nuclease of restriction endonuclease-like (RecB) superfamily